jgi:hypothetical protein
VIDRQARGGRLQGWDQIGCSSWVVERPGSVGEEQAGEGDASRIDVGGLTDQGDEFSDVVLGGQDRR